MPSVSITARLYSDATGAYEEVFVLLTPEGPLLSLLEYSRSSLKSASWNRKLVRAVSLFIDYLDACPDEQEEWKLFRNFASAIRVGSFDLANGLDPSGLCWLPFGQDAEYYIFLLSEFFGWLAERYPRAAKFNPLISASTYEARLREKAYLLRRSKAFLGHGWNPGINRLSQRSIVPLRAPKVAPRNPPAFPDAHFETLLFKGFKVGGRYDYRGMLILLLMHGAGFRVSETLHLYMCDVCPDQSNPKSADVRIHDPVYGKPPQGMGSLSAQGCTTRSAYLAENWGLRPRNKQVGSHFTGWKGVMLDGPYYMRAWWFHPELGELFLQLWSRYVEKVSEIDRDNPFAFVNMEREPRGGIYTLSSFEKAYYSAVKRIGLPIGRVHGTSPHGHRHAYMQRLRRAGIGELERQRFIHHRSIESQKIYTQPSYEESAKLLSDAANKLKD